LVLDRLLGDWRDLLIYAPFDLLFADGGKAKVTQPQTLITALKPGGLILLDDLHTLRILASRMARKNRSNKRILAERSSDCCHINPRDSKKFSDSSNTHSMNCT
ncbi:MAG: hypothetical protein ACYTXY_33085, partial [Nostoc sp.]